MAGKWPYKRVEEIALKIAMGPFGSSIKVETFTDSGIPIISGQHLREAQVTDGEFNFIKEAHADSLKNANVQRGDVIFTHAGNIGQVSFIPDDSAYQRYVISQRQFYLRCNTDLMLPEFITYYFKTPEGQHRLLANANQVGVPSIARPSSYLKTIEVPVPSIEEQQVAVRNIKALDAKIRLNIGINQTLEAMAQAIFKSWFVDFDLVKAKIAAKAEGRDRLRAAMTAISGKPDADLDTLPTEQYEQLASTAALFPDEMEESELGKIPKGWKANQINQFGDVICGKTPSKANPEYFGDGIPFIKIPDMHNSVYVVSPSERLSASGAASQAKKTIPPGSICISCIATVGKVVIAHEPSQTNQQINSIVPRLPQYTTYLYFQMKEKEKEFHDLASGGSATLNMNTSTFSRVGVLNPEFEVLEKFSALVAPLFSEILARQKQSALLSETRDTLLPKLLSGELSVTEAVAEVEA